MDVPLPLAASRRLMSFLTFHISMFFSASLGCGALIFAVGWPTKGGLLAKGKTSKLPERKRMRTRDEGAPERGVEVGDDSSVTLQTEEVECRRCRVD